MLKFFAILITIVAGSLVALSVVGNNGVNNQAAPLLNSQSTPSPSQIPFAELTIPYLRSRNYESELGDRQLYQNNGNFNSYLTSYDSDGLKINGLLTMPNGPVPTEASGVEGWPAIIFVHGYIAPSIYQTTERYQDYVNYFARNGYVVFKIDLRGHGDSEGEPGGAYYSSDYVIDTLNAYSALENTDFVNPNAIGLWGHSMAGNVVFRSMAVKPDIPAVAVWAGAGFSYQDLAKYGLRDNSYRPPTDNTHRSQYRQRLRDTYGQFDSNNIFWQQIAPTNYVNDLEGAIQLHHAIDDNVVNIGYSRDLVEVLDQTSVEYQLFEYQTGGHNLEGSTFGTAMSRTVQFYNQYLK